MAQLALAPAFVRFTATQERELEKYLSFIDTHTVHSDLSSPTDVRLDEAGRLRRGGYQFTTLALAQLCQKLCPGLSKTIFTISGLTRTPDDDPESFSIALATRIINDTATLRFSSLDGRQLVRNTKTGLIEGMTGAGYQFLSNKMFYETVCAAVKSDANKLTFHEAIIVGRKLTLYYKSHKPAIGVVDGWDSVDYFHRGFDFTNAETGECAVRTAPVLLLGGRDGVCLRGTKRRRLVHVGAHFSKNLALTIGRTLADSQVVRDIKDRIEELSQTSMGFGRLSESDHKARMQKYIGVLCQHKLIRSEAERIMRIAVYHNARPLSRPGNLMDNLAERTHYDLLMSLMTEARNVPSLTQEVIERIGYELLSSRLNVPRSE